MFKTSCQAPPVEIALGSLLNLRSNFPDIKAEWLEAGDGAEIFGVPTDYTPAINTDGQDKIEQDFDWLNSPTSHTAMLRGLYHQIGRFNVAGHGSVEITGCYHPRAFETCSIVFRGGLAICFISTKFTAASGSHRFAEVSWIEPGVSDQDRRNKQFWETKAPTCDLLKDLRGGGVCAFTSATNGNDGYYGTVWSDGHFQMEWSGVGEGPSQTYSVDLVGQILKSILAGEYPKPVILDSCLHRIHPNGAADRK